MNQISLYNLMKTQLTKRYGDDIQLSFGLTACLNSSFLHDLEANCNYVPSEKYGI